MKSHGRSGGTEKKLARTLSKQAKRRTKQIKKITRVSKKRAARSKAVLSKVEASAAPPTAAVDEPGRGGECPPASRPGESR